jgi:hypothetical protein
LSLISQQAYNDPCCGVTPQRPTATVACMCLT